MFTSKRFFFVGSKNWLFISTPSPPFLLFNHFLGVCSSPSPKLFYDMMSRHISAPTTTKKTSNFDRSCLFDSLRADTDTRPTATLALLLWSWNVVLVRHSVITSFIWWKHYSNLFWNNTAIINRVYCFDTVKVCVLQQNWQTAS